MKYLGLIIIFISTTALGFKITDNMNVRIISLREIRKMLILLRGEIMYNMSSIDEAFLNTAAKTAEPFSMFMKEVAKEIQKKDGTMFSKIWDEKLRLLAKTCLTRKDVKALKDFSEGFGCQYKENQVSSFNMYIEELEREIREADKKKDENSRLYRTLGIMSGLFIVIILI